MHIVFGHGMAVAIVPRKEELERVVRNYLPEIILYSQRIEYIN
jgi:hypothetical protein